VLGIINFGAFLVAALLLNLTPGVDTLYVLGRSATGGVRVGLVSGLGISTGLVVHTLIVALGLSVLLMGSVWLFWGIKISGACYLAFLGIRALMGKDGLAMRPNTPEAQGLAKAYVQGIITNVTNPKISLFFLAFLPQFVDSSTSLGPLPFLILGACFIITSTLWLSILALSAGQIRRLLDRRPRLASLMGRGSGILYLLLGISVFATPLPE
jgi:threonine/homoserine/homoserine lactone efflux protein